MSCFQCKCTCLSTIIAILSGVTLGVLYYLEYVATGIIFWTFLAIGVLAILLLPVYALTKCCDEDRCFCDYRKLLTIASLGTIITAAIGLLVPISFTILTAIVISFATFFAVLLIGSVICFTKCLCKRFCN